ncbi:MAG: hypothetical protein MUC49_22420 [Raineya sp.]|jgi:hypothetical protein|nr:hypothetical protein [Raineya sp.]
MKYSITSKLVLIIIISLVWTLGLPGLVAYQRNVFYGWEYKDKVTHNSIKSSLKNYNDNIRYLKKDTIVNELSKEKFKITFAGFAENGLNFIWLISHIVLLSLIFVVYRNFFSKILTLQNLLVAICIHLMLHVPIWIRNFSEIGRHGRKIYAFVNFDIDPISFFLQELRGISFALLLASFWGIYHIIFSNNQDYISQLNTIKDLKKFNEVGLLTKKSFINWQRDIFLTIILFLPWTFFFWKNITFHTDSRYILTAIIFHFLWFLTLITITVPFFKMNYAFLEYKNSLLEFLILSKSDERTYNYVLKFESLPKGQLILTAISTIISIFLPFLQTLFK